MAETVDWSVGDDGTDDDWTDGDAGSVPESGRAVVATCGFTEGGVA